MNVVASTSRTGQSERVRRWWRRTNRGTSREERVRQLEKVRDLASQISDQFRANGDTRSADLYADLGNGAVALLRDGFAQDDLNELSSLMPNDPWWLDPRAADYNAPRAQWQTQVAPVVSACRGAVLDLRIIRDL